MNQLCELKTIESHTGNLTVFDGIIPGPIQPVFYTYKAGQKDCPSRGQFSNGAILPVVSNELYGKDEYIYEPYPNNRVVETVLLADSE